MQTFLQTALDENPGWLAGWALLAVMGVYGLALLFGALRRLYFQRGQQALARQWMREEIKAAKIRTKEAEEAKLSWNGCRKFEVVSKTVECENVVSFCLAPHDKRPLPAFKPGQYITFQLTIPGQGKPVIRCYSLSDSHRPNRYRVTIKKVLPAPDVADGKPGLVSSYFCDTVREGDILDVKAPNGHFYMDLQEARPAVLISAGVGVTPMVSMVNAIIDSGLKTEVWFFFGARSREDHIFKEYLQKIAAVHDNLRLHVCYSRPEKSDVIGRDYHHSGRVTAELLKENLPSSNYDYFLCGPGPFMNSLTEGLTAWGVPEQNIHYEAFGPATVKKAAPPPNAADTALLSKLSITFSRLGKTFHWNPASGNLLDFAESKGAKIEAGCRAGNCGTCVVALKSGSVDYITPTGASTELNTCLACICRPKTDLVLDA
ncbi:MAG TPA: FAD-binding oxidoreductase [Verrucomicrobiae bacterium]|nr:FAD-binding oxidoreductase [Verrucomicrobiae bacterium]